MGAKLTFDWGEEEIGDVLVVGRDSATSPLAGKLQAFVTVSGSHAELRPVNEGVQIRHLSQTNPTYLDGRPLDAGETVIARNGARIGFSRAVTCTLKLAGK